MTQAQVNPAPQPFQLNDSARLVRIETLLEGIADKDRDFEARLRRVERIMWVGIGLGASAGSAIGSYVGQLPGH